MDSGRVLAMRMKRRGSTACSNCSRRLERSIVKSSLRVGVVEDRCGDGVCVSKYHF